MSLNIPKKKTTVKTSIDVEEELFKKAHVKMKKNGHTFRQVVEAALKQYIEETK